MAVKTPGRADDDRRAHLADMAVITGAIPLFKAAGDTLATARERPKDLGGRKAADQPRRSYFGQAKQAWTERTMFGLVSDRDNQDELAEHLADMLALREYAQDRDAENRLSERIGKILGGVAILRIGLDIRSGELADMAAAGIIDVASVTIDVLLHHKNPQATYEP